VEKVVPRPPEEGPPHAKRVHARDKGEESDASAASPPPTGAREPKGQHASTEGAKGRDSGNEASTTRVAVDVTSDPRATAVQTVRADRIAPNILRVEHWERLRFGALYASTPHIDWARLLRRTFDVDVLECTKCRGRLRVLGAVTERWQARAILEQLGLGTSAPRAARARDPTDDTDVDSWDEG
jgi:hypothetical protein